MIGAGTSAIWRGQPDGPGQQLLVRHDLGDQADPLGTRRVDHFACHRQPAGHRGADHMGESRRHPAAGQDPDAGVCVGEDRALGGDEKVTAQGHFEPTGEYRAVDGADDRRAHLAGLTDATLILKLFEVDRAEPLGLFEVHAGAERRVGAGEDHCPHSRVVVSLAECGIQRPDQVGAQRVSLCGPVHGQHPDCARVLGENQR